MNKNNSYKFIEKFLHKIRSEDGLSKNTITSYRQDLELLNDFLCERNIEIINCSKTILQDYLYDSEMQSLKSSSIMRKISCFKNFFKFLEDENLISQNPIFEIKAPKQTKKIPKFLSENEVNKMLDLLLKNQSEFCIKLSSMLEIMYSAGLRVSELVNLPFSAIIYKDNQIGDFLIIKGKGDKERIAPLNESSKKALKKYLEIRHKNGLDSSKWLFTGNFRASKKINPKQNNKDNKLNQDIKKKKLLINKDKPISRQRFHKMLKELAIQANIDPTRVHPHIFRHSFATHLLNRGADLRVLQELLGHSDISTTEIYTSVMSNKLQEAVLNKHPLGKIK